MSLETSRKGAIAESKVISAALEKEYMVSKPIHDTRYDLVFEKDNIFKRIQVKYCNAISESSSIQIPFYKCYYKKDSKHLIKTYSRDEIDLILVYLPKYNKILSFNEKIFHNRNAISIEFENKERKTHNKYENHWFEDYLF